MLAGQRYQVKEASKVPAGTPAFYVLHRSVAQWQADNLNSGEVTPPEDWFQPAPEHHDKHGQWAVIDSRPEAQ